MGSGSRLYVCVGWLVIAGSACTSERPRPEPAAGAPHADVDLAHVPHVQQQPRFGGEAAATMALLALGHDVDQDHVFDRAGVDPLEARGANADELARALGDMGFDVGQTTIPLGPGGAEEQLAALHADLERGVPSIVELAAATGGVGERHFVLVVGYEGNGDRIRHHDPARADGADLAMARREFLARWQHAPDDGPPSVARIRLAPGRADLVVSPPSATPTQADYAQHIIALEPRLEAGMTVLLRPPFVIIGDAERSRVEETARSVVWLAANDYEKHYFHTPPPITEVWIFRSSETYAYHTRRLGGRPAPTAFGFYDPAAHAVYANLATGGGTLLHELVHPYMRASIPDCPPWYNEGMGSLFESAGIRNGRLAGGLNWRLNGLKRAIRKNRLRPLADLLDLGSARFHGHDYTENYAVARYLVFYLQEHAMLDPFHKSFLLHHSRDPSGRRTLERTLGESLERFERHWRNWILQLDQQPVFLTFRDPELVRGQRWRF